MECQSLEPTLPMNLRIALLVAIGSFQLHAQDVTGFSLLKSLSYTQSTAGLPLPATTPYRFTASADTLDGGLLSGSIGVPGSSDLPLAPDGTTSWSVGSSYRTSNALEADYPGGTYLIHFHTAHQGDKTLSLAFPTGAFPNAPQIINYQAAQGVPPTGDFVPTWTPFTGGKATDFVRLTVTTPDGQEVFKTRGYGKSGALNGTSTGATIPAGTLSPGVTYLARLMFARPSGQNTDYGQGVTGTAAYYTETQFPIATLAGPDVKRLGVVKGISYRQTGVSTPVLVDVTPYALRVFADSSDGGLTSASVKLPNGTTQPFTSNNGDFGILALYPSAAGLDAAYPPGSYTLTLNTSRNGTQVVTLPLPASAFPNAPQLINFTAAQAVDPTLAFPINWNSFIGGGTNDFVQLQINSTTRDTVFQSPQPGQPGALNGTSTSATIPANALSPGETYQVNLLFARVLGKSTNYSLAFSAYFSQTDSSLVTTGNAVPPTLTVTQTGPSEWHLHANGISGRNYLIESAPLLLAPISWQPMVNFTGSSGGFDFTDGILHTQNFYRVRPAN